MTPLNLHPGNVSLAQWRSVYRGASARLASGYEDVVAASAAAVARILEKGVPVYGINTGFGKLAATRIEG